MFFARRKRRNVRRAELKTESEMLIASIPSGSVAHLYFQLNKPSNTLLKQASSGNREAV